MGSIFYERREENIFAGAVCEHPFPSHVHDVVEIVCLLTGSITMTIARRQVTLKPGDIAVVFPVIPHSYDAVSEDATGLTLIFAPDTIIEFYHAFRTQQPQQPLLLASKKAPELDPIIRGFYHVVRQDQNTPLKLGYLHLFLSYLFSCLPVQQTDQRTHSGTSYQVLQYISEHFTEPLTLESISRAMGLSRIHLSHIFSQQLHINFRQYINNLRIDLAQSLLPNPGYSISQIAYLCGYGNQRTFHRAFMSQCGITPNQYRAENRNSKSAGRT